MLLIQPDPIIWISLHTQQQIDRNSYRWDNGNPVKGSGSPKGQHKLRKAAPGIEKGHPDPKETVEKRPCNAGPLDCPRKATWCLPVDPFQPTSCIGLVCGAQLKSISCKYLLYPIQDAMQAPDERARTCHERTCPSCPDAIHPCEIITLILNHAWFDRSCVVLVQICRHIVYFC